ncbi:MAG: hypothetical protein K0R47_518 [Brevibacillus sp.]|nr:hypothetical protein [Brevibacillus sp.]
MSIVELGSGPGLHGIEGFKRQPDPIHLLKRKDGYDKIRLN